MVEIFPITVPQISANDESATIVEWFRTEGDQVSKDEALATLETTKSVFEVTAPANGFFLPLHEIGAEVPIAGTIGVISAERLSPDEARDAGGLQPGIRVVS